jgi:Flp pilus assembly secretin CpaC
MLIFTTLVLASLSASDLPESITLRMKEQREYKVENFSRIAVSNQSVAEVALKGAETLRIRGLAPGITSLIIWDTNGKRRSASITVETPSSIADYPAETNFTLSAGDAETFSVKGIKSIDNPHPSVVSGRLSGPARLTVAAKSVGRGTVVLHPFKGAAKNLVIEVVQAESERQDQGFSISVIELSTTSSVTLGVEGATSALLQTPALADVTVPGPGQVLIRGKQRGQTTLEVSTASKKLRVPLTVK